ncbi:hypothetical protein KY289_037403 [Solanum tuberosum]|nr:hypothetical protein KY289_037403 [Solanum tuberosum]
MRFLRLKILKRKVRRDIGRAGVYSRNTACRGLRIFNFTFEKKSLESILARKFRKRLLFGSQWDSLGVLFESRIRVVEGSKSSSYLSQVAAPKEYGCMSSR